MSNLLHCWDWTLISIATQDGGTSTSPLRAQSIHPEWIGEQVSTTLVEETLTTSKPICQFVLKVVLLLPEFLTQHEFALLKSIGQAWVDSLELSFDTYIFEVNIEKSAIDQLNNWIQQTKNTATSETLIIMSIVSWLDADLLDGREGFRKVGGVRSGLIAGEIGVGLVLVKDESNISTSLSSLPAVKLSKFSFGDVNYEASESTLNTTLALLTRMFSTQTKENNIDPSSVRAIVCSGGSNKNCMREVGLWLINCLSHLNPVDDGIYLESHFGNCSPAADLLALTLASNQTIRLKGPVLMFSNHHASNRVLTTISPIIQ